eukprot:scaffold11042_cov98-Phaeocystis_antarctica.AAC.4
MPSACAPPTCPAWSGLPLMHVWLPLGLIAADTLLCSLSTCAISSFGSGGYARWMSGSMYEAM